MIAEQDSQRLVLLTGATGYVGGRLLEALESAGHTVRCLARNPARLEHRVGAGTEVVAGDCDDPSSLVPALGDVDTAFYLVHSLGSGGDFADRDRQAAMNFGNAAKVAGVKRIVYLGGLGVPGENLSEHLKSRHETGETLRASGVPVVEFRASIILGSGSLSFELIRALVERLPVMVCPKWVRKKAQPIHIQDVVSYLVASLDLPYGSGRVYEIGGTDVVSYDGIMIEYARQRGLRRLLIPVPILTPYLSSLWLGLTTRIYARVGRKLIESLRNSTVVQDDSAMHDFTIRPVGLKDAIERAIRNEDRRLAATRWSDAASSGLEPRSWGGVQFGSRYVDSRMIQVAGSPEKAFAPIQHIGGTRGWYYADSLWKLRGMIDVLIGGVGLRRGRRDPDHLAVGDPLDCWRVEEFQPGKLLRLYAEMKLPGRAWLQFEVTEKNGKSLIYQTAMFDPVGLFGQLYWYAIYPLHDRIFSGMLKAIASRAMEAAPLTR